MTNVEEYTRGLWFDYLDALVEAEARSTESPYGLRDVAEVACDPVRIAVSDETRSGKAFLKLTKKALIARTERLQRLVDEYDQAQDG